MTIRQNNSRFGQFNPVPIPVESLQLSQNFWNAAAGKYEQAFTRTFVGKMWRDSVWRELDAGFKSGSRVLELNCGTGIDAIHLAQRGVSVLACDISSGMIELARKSAMATDVLELLDFRVLATERLATLQTDGMFDGAYSNFSGLNCVQDLATVSRNLARLLKPGSRLFLCMLGSRAALGRLWRLAHGDWRHVFRLTDNSLRQNAINVYNPSRKQIVDLFAPEFKLRKWKGVGIAVPPSYMEDWAIRFPGLTRSLDRLDRLIGDLPPFRDLGNCILFEFQRAGQQEDPHGNYSAGS
jgi:ubiquinone/menaquinone biosynthesis C-methylase UbiE